MSATDLRPFSWRRRRLRPEELGGIGMTICIGAVLRKQVVTVSDLLLSTSYWSAETSAAKVLPIDPNEQWLCMFSGSPTVRGFVLGRARDALRDSEYTAGDVAEAFLLAFREERQSKVEAEILSLYGIDLKTFREQGLANFGENEFRRLLQEVEDLKLNTEFLIVGFDSKRETPRLFSLSDPGIIEEHTALGFHAIGAGCVAALGSLFNTFSNELSFHDLVYRLCEAKFLGESAYGVGQRTFVVTADKKNGTQFIMPPDAEPIRRAWTRRRMPPIPPNARVAIAKSLKGVK